jgi:MFS transporter, ACS family, solute carrier family 17 (sodium-dependent inorganic phosphate cotransporter), other
MFVSSLFGAKLGTALTWPLMGFIIETCNWQCAFYVTAFCSLCVALIWYYVVADSPDKHTTICKVEQEYIEKSLELLITKKRELPPITKIVTSLPFYALLFLHFSDVWGVFFLLTSAPMFMRQVLGFDLKSAGIVASFPYLAQLVMGFVFGAIGDYLVSRGYNVTKIRKVFCIFCEFCAIIFRDIKLT